MLLTCLSFGEIIMKRFAISLCLVFLLSFHVNAVQAVNESNYEEMLWYAGRPCGDSPLILFFLTFNEKTVMLHTISPNDFPPEQVEVFEMIKQEKNQFCAKRTDTRLLEDGRTLEKDKYDNHYSYYLCGKFSGDTLSIYDTDKPGFDGRVWQRLKRMRITPTE